MAISCCSPVREADGLTCDAAYETIRVWIVELEPDDVMLGKETLAERRART